ncbi:endonuclease domain-containing protein [Lentzea indica]|uniref:endonuclease domain-containing protein n=1 Tax=Lentzea indica TaxID=2604800 RepID=UPI0035E4304A
MIKALGWACSGCGRRGEFVDHDHFTGMVRGFLCKHCGADRRELRVITTNPRRSTQGTRQVVEVHWPLAQLSEDANSR